MTGLIFAQYWIILFLWVGLAVSRRFISRYPNLAIILVLARSFFRIVVLQNESAGDRTFSSLLASEWLIIVLNLIAIVALLAEMIAGHRCWRLRIIRARKRRKKRAKQLSFNEERGGD
jgi:heme exporter protein D